MSHIVDIHTHCVLPSRDDPFGVGHVFRGRSVEGDIVSNFRGLPAIGHREMADFDWQQATSAKAGVTRRIISNPFSAEAITQVSSSPAIDVVKHGNDLVAAIVAKSPSNLYGMGHVNPLDEKQVAEAERCVGALGFKGLLLCSSWHKRFIDNAEATPFWEWADATRTPIFIHPPRAPIGADQEMGQYKLDELVGRPFDTAMALARMILSGMFDRFQNLNITVAHMGGGLLPVMGRLNFGWRLGSEGLPEHAKIRCAELPSDYLRRLNVDTMGLWGPHLKQAVEVFGADRVMFGTDFGPVPIDPKEHIDIVNALPITEAQKQDIFWRNADRVFGLGLAAAA